jgi:arylformamidase
MTARYRNGQQTPLCPWKWANPPRVGKLFSVSAGRFQLLMSRLLEMRRLNVGSQAIETIKWTDGREKRVYDISVPLSSETPTFPGASDFRKESRLRLAKGDRVNISELTLGSHAATHVDAPNHFIDDMYTIDKILLRKVVGRARVFDLKVAGEIDTADIQPLGIEPGIIALFKTRNSQLWKSKEFTQDYVYLTEQAAQLLAEKDVAAVGVDYLCPDEFENLERPVHHVLFRKGVILIEGLDLGHVPAGDYFLICLPLKIKGSDGAPARAILIEL